MLVCIVINCRLLVTLCAIGDNVIVLFVDVPVLGDMVMSLFALNVLCVRALLSSLLVILFLAWIVINDVLSLHVLLQCVLYMFLQTLYILSH